MSDVSVIAFAFTVILPKLVRSITSKSSAASSAHFCYLVRAIAWRSLVSWSHLCRCGSLKGRFLGTYPLGIKALTDAPVPRTAPPFPAPRKHPTALQRRGLSCQILLPCSARYPECFMLNKEGNNGFSCYSSSSHIPMIEEDFRLFF